MKPALLFLTSFLFYDLAQAVSPKAYRDISVISSKLSTDEFAKSEPNEEPGEKSRKWIIQWLERNKFQPAGDNGSFLQTFEGGHNILAMKYPNNQVTANSKPSLILSAHYDKLSECTIVKKSRSQFCNGAADNASSVAIAMAVANDITTQINAPVLVALWDGEEKGLLGSKAFADHPTVALEGVNLLINLDIIGSDLYRGLEQNLFVLGSETGGAQLVSDIQASKGYLDLKLLSYAFSHDRSDHTSFMVKGYEIPTVFFSDADGGYYHTSGDEISHLNFMKVFQVANLVENLSIKASEVSYEFTSPSNISGFYIPRGEDIAPLKRLLGQVIRFTLLNGLKPEQKEQLESFSEQLNVMEAKDQLGQEDFVLLGRIVQTITAYSRERTN